MLEHHPFDPHQFPDAHLLDTAQLDQHLLANPAALRTLIDTAQPNRTDVIADLGAGTGLIAADLHDRYLPARIYANEIDARFGPYLERLRRRSAPRIELVRGDILACHLRDVTKVIANPPFRITEQLAGWLHRLPALESATLVMGQSFTNSATAEPGSARYNRISLMVQARFTVRVVRSLTGADFYPTARSPAQILHLVPNRARAVDQIVDTALTHAAGRKVKDFLWYLQRNAHAIGPPARRRHLVAKLRASTIVRRVYQRRLQQLTSAELSHLMAELHRHTVDPDPRD